MLSAVVRRLTVYSHSSLEAFEGETVDGDLLVLVGRNGDGLLGAVDVALLLLARSLVLQNDVEVDPVLDGEERQVNVNLLPKKVINNLNS